MLEVRSLTKPARRIPVVLVGWVVLVVAARIVGADLVRTGHRMKLRAAPLAGHFEWRINARMVGLLAVGALLVWFGPRIAERLPWKRLLAIAFAATVVWALSLSFLEGADAITDPMVTPSQYIHDVPAMGNPVEFLRTYEDRIGEYHVHTRVHPPGMPIVYWVMDRVGLGGAGPAAALAILGGAAAVLAVMLTVRELSGEEMARRAAPFIVLSPLALFIASTPDSFFMGVGAWATYFVVRATGETGRRADLLALAGGALFFPLVMFSYGLTLLGAVSLGVAIARRSFRPVVVACIPPAIALLAIWAGTGFFYLEGLKLTHAEYYDSVAERRPYNYFVWANWAAVAIFIGPITVAGLTRLRLRGEGLVAAGALAALFVAGTSGMAKGEVERIYMPFMIWLLPAGAWLGETWRERRRWLALSAGYTAVLQLALHTLW